ncbi:MAG TPA: carbon storage regulator [Planctomycetaceae bacterium]|nr:carbon storage regulator [Planctomycetaceae bacterium]
MLVLSRKKNESIVINENITIMVVEVRGDKVRLGIEAPRDVPVHRREIFEAILASRQADSKQGIDCLGGNPTEGGSLVQPMESLPY